MGRQYTRKHKGGESQQEILDTFLATLTDDADRIQKDIEALRDSLKTPEVSKKEEVEEDFSGLIDMFSTKTFDEQSEAAKKSKNELDATKFKLFNEDLRQYTNEISKKTQKDRLVREGSYWLGNRAKLIEYLKNKIERLNKVDKETNSNHKDEIKSYSEAIEGIEKATTLDGIKDVFYKNKLDNTILTISKTKDKTGSNIWRGNRRSLIQNIQKKITMNTNSNGNYRIPSNKYHRALEEIEKAKSVDDIMTSLSINQINLGVDGQLKGGKTKKLQKKSKKMQRKSHKK